MKSLKKTKRNLLVLVLCLFVFSGCTSTFCNSEDKASMREYFITQNYDEWYEDAVEKYEINVEDGVSTEEQEKIDSYMTKQANKTIKKEERACIATKDYTTKKGYKISGKNRL